MSVKQIHGEYVVYSVQDPDSTQVRYIGITKDLSKRMREHRHLALSGRNTHFYKWYRSVLSKSSLGPLFIKLMSCNDYKEACNKERELIARYKANGSNLCNHTSGGEGLFNPSQEVISKIKEKRKLQVFSQASREKMRLAKLGKKRGPMSQETKDKIKNAVTGYQHTEASRKLMSMQRRGKLLGPNNPDTRINRHNKSSLCKKITDQDGNMYSSVNEASRQLNIGATCIRNQLLGYSRTTHGKVFKYVNMQE